MAARVGLKKRLRKQWKSSLLQVVVYCICLFVGVVALRCFCFCEMIGGGVCFGRTVLFRVAIDSQMVASCGTSLGSRFRKRE